MLSGKLLLSSSSSSSSDSTFGSVEVDGSGFIPYYIFLFCEVFSWQ